MNTKIMLAGILAAAGMLSGGMVHAQSVTVYCDSSDICFVDSTGISYDTISWTFDKKQTDAIFPRNCTNSTSCSFYCPNRPGTITAGVRLIKNNQIVATASSPAQCTAQPI